MTGEPEATVVLPTRDRPTLARRAIESALAQISANVEVVVIDDGSQVPFPDISDRRVRVVRNPRSTGVCAARNIGLDLARGSWVTFLDDDDELAPTMIAASVAAALQSTLPRPVATLSAVEVTDADGRVVRIRRPPTFAKGKRYFLEPERCGDLQVHNSLVLPTGVARQIGGWDSALLSWEHDDFFLRLNAECSLEGLDEPLYRLTASAEAGGVRLSSAMLARADAMSRTYAKHRAAFGANPAYAAKYLGTISTTYLRAGCWRPAVVASTRSLLRDPRRSGALIQWGQAMAGPRIRGRLEPWRRRVTGRVGGVT
jgi:glycosyltransferase involved in cell wall biosynthesis